MHQSIRKLPCFGTILINLMALQPVVAQTARQSKVLQQSDLKYLGAFRLPHGKNGEVFEFGGSALAYHEKRDSLFLVGHDQQQAISEIQIPEITAARSMNYKRHGFARTNQDRSQATP